MSRVLPRQLFDAAIGAARDPGRARSRASLRQLSDAAIASAPPATPAAP